MRIRGTRFPSLLMTLGVTALITTLHAPGSEAQQTVESRRLHELLDEAWDFQLREDPMLATSVGEHGYNDRLPSVSAESQERRADYWRGVVRRLAEIERSALEGEDGISYDMFRRQAEEAVREVEFRTYEIPLTADWGFHVEFAQLPGRVPLVTTADYENYVARLHAFPTFMNEHITNMRSGMARGFTMPRVVLDGYEMTIEAQVVNDPTASAFYAPFASFPSGVAQSEHIRLRQAGRDAVVEAMVPSYRTFLRFMVDEYMPFARTTLGAAELPDGPDYYAYLIRHFTTLEITAQEIHDIGLAEVDRIRGEMLAIIEEVGYAGSFAEFLDFLRTDPQFYAGTPEELLKEASYLAKRMDGSLPSLFGRLPRQPYGVAPVPDEIAPKFTGGRYIGAPKGGTQPGYYWVNTYNLPSRPLYVLPALTLHEAVPGHHLQIALTQELEDLPEFRRTTYLDVFGEGWGLYSEYLGIEAGMYTTPYTRFGRLTYEMWRACRLVVDTGLHAMGWTRDQAMDYMASRTALSLHEIRTETDRYISWPGQALAYKMGELKIRELRGEAEEALGELFDVREFHDAILSSGTVPLTVMEDKVRGYIRERQLTR